MLKLDDPGAQLRTLEDKVQSTEDLVYRRTSQETAIIPLNPPPASPMSVEGYRRPESVLSGLPSQVDQPGTLQSVSGILDVAHNSYAVVPVLIGNKTQSQLTESNPRGLERQGDRSLESQLSDHAQRAVPNSKIDRGVFSGLNGLRSESQNSVELEGSKDKNEGGTNGTPLQEVQVSTLNWSYNQEHSSPLQETKTVVQLPATGLDEHDICQEYPNDLPMDEVEEPLSQMGSGAVAAIEPDNGGVSLKYYKENPQLDALTGNFTMPYRYYSEFGNDGRVAEEHMGELGDEDQEGHRHRPTQQTASVPQSSRILEFSNSLLPTIRSMDSTATKEGALELTLGGQNQMRPPTPEGPLYPQESLNLWTEKQPHLDAGENDELGQAFQDPADLEVTLGGQIAQDLMEALIEEAISEQQEIKFRLSVCPQDDQLKVRDDISAIEAMYGIRTNLASVGEYLNLLVDFLIETQADELISKYNRGHEMDPLETIKILRENEVHMYMSEGENQELLALSPEYEYQELPMALLLESEIFDVLKTEMLSNLEDSTEIGRLIQLQGVFHKSIFDCFNEVISTLWQRDVAIDFLGLVMYRKQQPLKKLSGREDLEKVLVYAKDIALDYAAMMCGTIRDKEDSMAGFVRGMDANGLNQLREDRLIKMLAMEIFDKEKFWVDYSQEMLISLIDCADKVCEDLVAEVVEDMVKLHADSSLGLSED